MHLALKGLKLDDVWNNVVQQNCGIRVEDGHMLDKQIAVDEERAKYQKEIDRLETLVRKEK